MISYLLRSIAIPKWRSWKPREFSNSNFTKIPPTQLIEEETIPGYVASRYYPTRIGEVLKNRYQVVGKLGYGLSSTVWLARDLDCRRYVALKIYVNATCMGSQLDGELNVYRRMQNASDKHPGARAVRELLDSFDIDGPKEKHRCLVHPPLWESILTFLRRNPIHKLPVTLLALVLQRVFLALDYLHNECKVIHTDIKADNIMFGISDEAVFANFEEQELMTPSPRKEIDGRTIYTSRQLMLPPGARGLGPPVLCDFGSAVPGDVDHDEDIQPNWYRAPEVILGAPWTYSVDIWNVGCMIWDIFENEPLFTGHDPELQTYQSRAHIAEIIGLLGPMPPNLLARAASRSKFFDKNGNFIAGVPIRRSSLEDRVTDLAGEDKEKFLSMVREMLQLDPSMRSSAKSLLKTAWMADHVK